MEKMFLRVSDVEEILDVSESYAYKLIRKLNKEMKAMGFQTIPGRIDTKFFYEHFYQTKNFERGDA
ncbi:MAG: DNA-binding protein [Lachnospiraceae bacterium]|nr:DNA-binding protein [Lachnospiraceae bacterium]